MTVAASLAPGVSAPPGAAVARAVHATKIYGSGNTAVRALDDVTVDFPTGRFTAIMGPSGSGKSTLMHCVAGLDRLTSGHAYLGGVELGELSDRELTLLRRERVGFVFQAYNLIPTLTAAENVVLPLRLAGAKPDQDWLDVVVDTVGLGDRLRHRPAELSGGEQQRVAVARALANRPPLLLADEPTGELDATTGAEMIALFDRVNRDGTTILVVTHDEDLARAARRVVHMRDGLVVDDRVQARA
jgi:putative ABC transport system ATP-binding protein